MMKTRPEDTPQEDARLAELRRLDVLDSLEEQAYDDITRMAADTCGTPIALISLIDADRQWFKARVGMKASETSRESSFCAHAIQTSGQPMVVKDATKDPRFATNPLVTGDPNIRFYAGAPLVTASGHALGTICVIDTEPRDVSAAQLEHLRFMAQQVVLMLEQRVAAARNASDPKAPADATLPNK